jgi:hypothetical protein
MNDPVRRIARGDARHFARFGNVDVMIVVERKIRPIDDVEPNDAWRKWLAGNVPDEMPAGESRDAGNPQCPSHVSATPPREAIGRGVRL